MFIAYKWKGSDMATADKKDKVQAQQGMGIEGIEAGGQCGGV